MNDKCSECSCVLAVNIRHANSALRRHIAVFLVLPRKRRDFITNLRRTSSAVSFYLPIWTLHKFGRQRSENIPNRQPKNPSGGSRFVPYGQKERRTDRHDGVNSFFSQFLANAPAYTFWSVRHPDDAGYTYSHVPDLRNDDELSQDEPRDVAVPLWIAAANVKSQKPCRPASNWTDWDGQPRELKYMVRA